MSRDGRMRRLGSVGTVAEDEGNDDDEGMELS